MRLSERFSALLLVLAAVAVAAAVSPVEARNASPRLLVRGLEQDLGIYFEGEDIHFEFEIRNGGDADLHILKVRLPGYHSGIEYDRVIPPGESGSISGMISARRLHAGSFGKRIKVTTDDPDNPELTLFLKGKVIRIFDVMPGPFLLTGYKGDRPEKEIPIEVAVNPGWITMEDIELTGYHWRRESADFQIMQESIGVKIRRVEKGGKYILKIWLKKDLPPDIYFADLCLETGFEEAPEKVLPVRLKIME